MMAEDKIGHLVKLPLDAINETVEAEPRVAHSEAEIAEVLVDLYNAVDKKTYIPQTPTIENPALSDDYVFDTNDENLVLKDLKRENFVGKVKDLSRGATKRRKRGLPEEYLYVFKYACKLLRRDAQSSGVDDEDILIYIKVNDRKTPFEKVFVISFHKNRPKH
jgi:uncharacterized protein (UPF0297 family)